MIIFLTNGRLGNQIFVYAFLKTLSTPGERIYSVGLEELQSVFPVNDIINKSEQQAGPRRLKIIRQSLSLLSRLRLITRIEAGHEKVNGNKRETTMLKVSKGLFGNIKYIKRGLFQSEAYFKPEAVSELEPFPQFQNEADAFFANIPKDAYRVFVHIRRGDYQSFMVNGHSAVLPLSYYRQQVDYFQNNRKNVLFVFLSDSPELIRSEFSHIENKIISEDNSFGTDFTIMTRCHGAIISASSFSWWGAYFMKNRDLVFAPRYWLGFRSKFECHQGAIPSFATAVDIEEDA